MKNKIYLGTRVYNIANQYDISSTIVHRIIKEYIEYSKNLLLHGERIDFLGLLYIEPDVKFKKYNTTLGYICKQVSNKLQLPSHTVYVIIKEYLLSLKEGLFEGKTAEIRGIVTIHPIVIDGKITKIHSAISLSIKKYLEDNKNNTIIHSARVHTYKNLREEISNV